MSYKLSYLFPGNPNTERGRGAFVDVSRDGKQLAYGSGKTVVILDLEDKKNNKVINKHKAEVTAVRFQPANGFMCSGDATGFVSVWSLMNEDNTTKVDVKAIGNEVRSICWTGDGKRIVVVGNGKEETAKAFAWDSATNVGKITGHSGELLTCDMYPIKRPIRCATAGTDYAVNFHKGAPFVMLESTECHKAFINQIRYAPDASVFASVSSDKKVVIFGGKDGKIIEEIEGAHKSSIYGVAFSPESDKFVTSSADKSLKFWDLESKKEENQVKFESKVWNIQLGANWSKTHGPFGIGLNGTISFIEDDKIGKQILGHNKKITGCDYNGKLAVSGYGGSVVYDIEKGGVERYDNNKNHEALLWNDDELLISSHSKEIFFCKPGTPMMKSKKISTKRVVTKMCKCGDAVLGVMGNDVLVIKDQDIANTCNLGFPVLSIDAHGEYVAIGSKKKVYLFKFDGSNLKELKCIDDEHEAAVVSVKFSKDGKKLASADSEMFVFEVPSMKKIHKDMADHNSSVTCIDWIDENTLVTSSLDKTWIKWNLSTKKKEKYMASAEGIMGVYCVDDSTIATFGCDKVLKVWKQ